MTYERLENWREKKELLGLLDLKDPPKQLFFKGKWEEGIFNKCAGVVGSRRMTEYGRRVVEMVVTELVQAGYTIISGFMYGIDQEAHRKALEIGGKTIAILGHGINWPLFEREKKLEAEILAKGGLIISEWEEQAPTLWTFPLRNRLVVGMSSRIVVVEAGEKSGSLITANLAVKYGRELYSVPGMITSRSSAGTNSLIREGKARLWMGGKTIEQMKIFDNPILNLLADEELAVDEIARKLSRRVEEVAGELMKLSLSGQVAERGGKYLVAEN